MMQLNKSIAARHFAKYCIAATLCASPLCNPALAEDIHPRSPSHAILQLPPAPTETGTVVPPPAPEVTVPNPPSTAPAPTPKAVPAPTHTAAKVLTSPTTSTATLRQAAQRLKLPLPLPASRIVVTKAARRLDLYSGKTLVKSYHVALGARPAGPKQQQGDGRTPEGQFYICTRNASTSAFHIFLGLSYPALPDATQAARKKVISWREYQLIRQRLSSRGVPPWRTRLGGWVGIHGGTDAAFAKRKTKQRGTSDWTAGCIALTNREIREIYTATRLGTPVLVLP